MPDQTILFEVVECAVLDPQVLTQIKHCTGAQLAQRLRLFVPRIIVADL